MIWGDGSNAEKAGGYTTSNLSEGWRFRGSSSWLRKPCIKVNAFDLADWQALTYARSPSAFLASNLGQTQDADGTTLFPSAALLVAGRAHGDGDL